MGDTPDNQGSQESPTLESLEAALSQMADLMEEGFKIIFAQLDALSARVDAIEAEKRKKP